MFVHVSNLLPENREINRGTTFMYNRPGITKGKPSRGTTRSESPHFQDVSTAYEMALKLYLFLGFIFLLLYVCSAQ